MTTNFSDPHSRFYFDSESFIEHIPAVCSPCSEGKCFYADNAKNDFPCDDCARPYLYDLSLSGEYDYNDIPDPPQKPVKMKVKPISKSNPVGRTLSSTDWQVVADLYGFENHIDMLRYYRIEKKMGLQKLRKLLHKQYETIRLEVKRLGL